MYRPDQFRVEDVARMHALMRARPFASLVSNGSTGLCASHLPTVLKDEGSYGVIECHLARANPHWKDVASGNEALMIFQGPEGYITPNWYPSKAHTAKSSQLGTMQSYMRTVAQKRWRTKTGCAGMWASLLRSKSKPRPDLGRFRTHLNLTSMPCCAASRLPLRHHAH